ELNFYQFIDPQVHYDVQTYARKTVLITGASRGIGLETAKFYACAGASLTIVGRKPETLEASKDATLREQPSASVFTFAADVRDVKKAEEAVTARPTIAHSASSWPTLQFSGHKLRVSFANNDPMGWWDVLEVNIRGTYNFIHFSVPELVKNKRPDRNIKLDVSTT
ncbi:hypothetical protein BGW80DRAFT_1514064, partial [Lactifluus volemus]